MPGPERIKPEDRVPLRLSRRECDLIVNETFAPEELTDRLRLGTVSGGKLTFGFTLEELDELIGSVAAKANHTKDKKLQKELDRIYERMAEILDTYTDQEEW